MKYVWTENAETKAKELNLDERKAGEVAHFGTGILEDGPTAQAWLKDGFIRPETLSEKLCTAKREEKENERHEVHRVRQAERG